MWCLVHMRMSWMNYLSLVGTLHRVHKTVHVAKQKLCFIVDSLRIRVCWHSKDGVLVLQAEGPAPVRRVCLTKQTLFWQDETKKIYLVVLRVTSPLCSHCEPQISWGASSRPGEQQG